MNSVETCMHKIFWDFTEYLQFSYTLKIAKLNFFKTGSPFIFFNEFLVIRYCTCL